MIALAVALLLTQAAPEAQAAPQANAASRRPSVEALERSILSRAPQTRVESPDHDRLTARRIDIVDENGVIRLTLAGATPGPIIDGIEYRRAFNVAGITVYDASGGERGGFGTADVPGGAAVLALDHPAMDAVGWRVMPDGAVSFVINQAPPLVREPAIGDRLVPGVATSTRVTISVAADGVPSVALADADNRPRVRMTVTPEGFGALEFLNAAGEVIHVLAPEADRRPD